jgi:hypothetical protein
MPGIVIGEERKVDGGPGELSKDALQRARKALEEKKKQKEKDKKPKPDLDTKPTSSPEGFSDPVWSSTQVRWMCCSRDDKWQVWDKENWYDLAAFEKC